MLRRVGNSHTKGGAVITVRKGEGLENINIPRNVIKGLVRKYANIFCGEHPLSEGLQRGRLQPEKGNSK